MSDPNKPQTERLQPTAAGTDTPSPISSSASPAGKPLPPPNPAARRTRPLPVSLVLQAQDALGKLLGLPPHTIKGLQNNIVWRDGVQVMRMDLHTHTEVQRAGGDDGKSTTRKSSNRCNTNGNLWTFRRIQHNASDSASKIRGLLRQPNANRTKKNSLPPHLTPNKCH